MNVSAPNRERPFEKHAARPLARRGGWLNLFSGVFHRILDRIDAGLLAGGIEASLPDGTRRVLGCREPGPVAIVDMASWRALVRLVTSGSTGWYEAWRDGEWSSPDPVPLFDLFMRNAVSLGGAARSGGFTRLVKRCRHWLRRNHLAGARRNIEFHYDLGNDFYELWLDPGMTYSSAMFDGSPGQPLEAAQATKLTRLVERTGAKPGNTILEIGCGWGSFAEAAGRAGIGVHAITLSAEQQRAVEARVARAGLSNVTVARTDYRDVTGAYDAVASIEMVEAVGQEYWPAYLAAISRALKPGGRAAIQYIAIDDAIFDAYARNVDFIQRYVFPGGLLLSERRFRALAEAAGFIWTDQQRFGQDYAKTLRRWRQAFDAAVDAGRLPAKFDPEFIDLWRYYLMYCEGGFGGGGIDVAQVTLVKRV